MVLGLPMQFCLLSGCREKTCPGCGAPQGKTYRINKMREVGETSVKFGIRAVKEP